MKSTVKESVATGNFQIQKSFSFKNLLTNLDENKSNKELFNNKSNYNNTSFHEINESSSSSKQESNSDKTQILKRKIEFEKNRETISNISSKLTEDISKSISNKFKNKKNFNSSRNNNNFVNNNFIGNLHNTTESVRETRNNNTSYNANNFIRNKIKMKLIDNNRKITNNNINNINDEKINNNIKKSKHYTKDHNITYSINNSNILASNISRKEQAKYIVRKYNSVLSTLKNDKKNIMKNNYDSNNNLLYKKESTEVDTKENLNKLIGILEKQAIEQNNRNKKIDNFIREQAETNKNIGNFIRAQDETNKKIDNFIDETKKNIGNFILAQDNRNEKIDQLIQVQAEANKILIENQLALFGSK